MTHLSRMITALVGMLALALIVPLTGCRTTRAQLEAAEPSQPPDETGDDTPSDPEGPKPKPAPPGKP